MKVEHDRDNKKFYIALEGEEAFLNYAEQGKVLNFLSVYVPDAFRNRGYAGKIAIAAFEFADKEGYQVIPTCPFISSQFLPRFPQYQSLVKPV